MFSIALEEMRTILILSFFLLLIGFGLKSIHDPDSSHINHLPLYSECDISVKSASAPEVSLHVREWEVESPKYVVKHG